MEPKISIIIPCYNHGLFLAETLMSVLQQTYTNYECLVVNDGSTDNSSDVARTIINAYPDARLKFFDKKNEGVLAARHDGIKQTQSDYILFLDADDLIHPDFLTETSQMLTEQSSVGFVYTNVQHIGSRFDIWSGGEFDPRKLLFENQLTCTSLMRRSMFEEVGGFKDVMAEGYEDWEFWISCVEAGWSGKLLSKPYFYYRKHSNESRLMGLSAEQDKRLRQQIAELHPELYQSVLAEIQKGTTQP